MKTATVILAGGEGRRIGGAKPLRMLAGVTLIDRALARATSWSSVLAIAVRDPKQVGSPGVPVIADAPDIEGPLAGLAAALRFARSSGCAGVLTIPADMPFLPTDLPDRLAGAIDGRCAAIAASGSHLHPVCGLWRVETADHFANYLSTGRRSLRDFAEAVGMVEVNWTSDPRDPFFNINSPEDLEAAERILRG